MTFRTILALTAILAAQAVHAQADELIRRPGSPSTDRHYVE